MASKEMAVEKIYQKKSQLEHILLRPDTYIGSVELLQQEMWIWDFDNEKMIKKEIAFVPGLYKIFDEILVNAADNKQRDPNMSIIRVNIDKENNRIRIFNNGRGIPVVEHKDEKVLVPTLIFGHLLTSSNYNDDEKKVTGGRNGFGAKLCNIFSKKFTLETSSKEYKKSFKQVWSNNMAKADEPVVKDAREDDFTCITFEPDLAKFKMERLDDDTVALLARRAYDVAASSPGVKVYLNDKRLPVSKFEDYCKLYLSTDSEEPVKLTYEKPNDRWEVAIACSDIGFQQVSFVNSIATTKGGRHVDYIVDQIVKYMSEVINKKNKNGAGIKPFQIKNHLWVFINCLIENPTFDSQTKENMTLQTKSFGSKCTLTDEFFKKLTKAGLLDRIMNWLAFKERTDLEKAGSKSKMGKIKGIPKLDDANDAGTKNSTECTLIVTEGDSAKTLAVAGLGVIGRDKYGVFPLRGKMLNVREATTKQILENSEVSNLLKIIGLNFKEKYETRESLKQLRYGKLMIMTDQDHDGSHIKGLVINFVHYQWPNLLKHGFVEEFITPIVKVSKGNQEKSFYSMPEFEEWQNNTENWMSWKIKYYKGLGTSTSKEAKEYFSNMQRHRVKFEYGSRRDDLAIQLAFSKKYVEERKDWLTRFMETRKLRRENNDVDDYLYQKDTNKITYTDFVNKELVLFSNLDNERSIPSLVDGFKPGQRKVLFACFKRNLVKEIKVAQLAGSVAELSSYHHGEASLMSTIINLAQNFVGSNNINLLMPIGQFGTRLHGGKDAASPRYIFTHMSPLTRLLFNPKDDPLFSYINDDGQRVEPEWYCPIIPTVLVNGAEGIGTGWSTKIPNYNPREIIENLRLMINGREPKPMKPYFKNFKGSINQIDDIRVVTSGVVSIIGDNTIEITELPIGTWTQAYKESVLESYLHGSDSGEKKIAPTILDYREYHTDTTVRFIVKMSPEQFREAEKTGFHKFFKLQKTLSLNSMVLFDPNGCLKRYDNINEILKEFFDVRIDLYKKRKVYMEGMLGAESLKLDNIARFILEKIEGKIKVENLKKADICKILKDRKYDPDPVLKWRESTSKDALLEENNANESNASEENETQSKASKDYDYLLGMPIWNLTTEKKDEILKQQRAKAEELAKLKAKTTSELWVDDLDQFVFELDKVETKEKDEESAAQLKAYKAGLASKGGSKNMIQKKTLNLEYLPAPDGELVEAKIDPALIKETAVQKVKKEEKKENNLVDVITSTKDEMDDKQIEQFFERSSKPVKKEVVKKSPKKATKKVKEEADLISDNEEGSTSTKASKKVEPSKKPSAKPKSKPDGKDIKSYFSKKNKSDDSEISMDYMSDDDDTESAPVERKVSSRAKKDVKYADGESDNDDKKTSKKRVDDDSENDVILDDDNDDDDYDFASDFKTNKKKVKKAKSFDDEDEEESVKLKPKPQEKKEEQPKKETKIKKTNSKTALKRQNKNDSEEDIENKPPIKTLKKTEPTSKLKESNSDLLNYFKPKEKTNNNKKSNYREDDDSFVVDDSDDEDYEEKPKAKPKQKKLLSINSNSNLNSKTGSKKAVTNHFNDDDLFEVDD